MPVRAPEGGVALQLLDEDGQALRLAVPLQQECPLAAVQLPVDERVRHGPAASPEEERTDRRLPQPLDQPAALALQLLLEPHPELRDLERVPDGAGGVPSSERGRCIEALEEEAGVWAEAVCPRAGAVAAIDDGRLQVAGGDELAQASVDGLDRGEPAVGTAKEETTDVPAGQPAVGANRFEDLAVTRRGQEARRPAGRALRSRVRHRQGWRLRREARPRLRARAARTSDGHSRRAGRRVRRHRRAWAAV